MKLRYLFLFLVGGATLSGYVLVFGDQGYLMQNLAERRLAGTRAAIRGLEKENRNLSEQYARLKERAPDRDPESGDAAPAARPGVSGTATILKFEDDRDAGGQRGRDGGSLPGTGESLTIVEARALFLTGMFFLAILGYYGITRLERMLHANSADRR